MAGETERNIAIRLRIEQQGNLRKPSTSESPEVKQAKEERKALRDKAKDEEKARKDAERESRRRERDAAKQQRELESLTNRSREFGLNAQENFIRAGEGAFRFARGLALLGVANEKELKPIINTLATVQAGFDLFKGGIDVLRGLSEGMRLMRASSQAAAGAEALRTGATLTATAATQTATTAAISFRAALGPIGIALAAAAVAAATTETATKKLADAFGLTSQQTSKLQKFLNIFSYKGVKDLWEMFTGGAEAALDFSAALNRVTQQYSDVRRLNEELRQLQTAMPGFAPGTSQAQGFANSLAAQLQAAESGQAGRQNRADRFTGSAVSSELEGDMKAARQAASDAAQVQAELLHNQEESVALRRQQLSLLQQEGQELRKQRDAAMGILDATLRNQQAKKSELESAEARFGRLSRQDQEFVKQTDKKLARGEELSEAELRRLEQTGFGGNTAEQANRRRGQDAGFGGLQVLNDEARALDQANRDAAAAQASYGEAVNELTDQITANAQAQTQAVQGLMAALQALQVITQGFNQATERLERLQREMDQANQ